jgi:hypothetical protein
LRTQLKDYQHVLEIEVKEKPGEPAQTWQDLGFGGGLKEKETQDG